MTFQEALNAVMTQGLTAYRRTHYFDDDYDRPKNNNDPPTPWSDWTRIWLDDDKIDFDALVFIEGNSFDEVTKEWIQKWTDGILSKADFFATDWELREEEHLDNTL